MVMDEAARAGRRDWYLLARQRLWRHVEVAWDPVYGGLFRALSIDTHTFLLDKIGWVQQEGLLGIAMALEGATEGVTEGSVGGGGGVRSKGTCGEEAVGGDSKDSAGDNTDNDTGSGDSDSGDGGDGDMSSWSLLWFRRMFQWTQTHMRLKPHGYPLWKIGGDRRATFDEAFHFAPGGGVGSGHRKENYHHPRCVMLLLEMVERMLPPETAHPRDPRAAGAAAGGDRKKGEGGAEGNAAAP